MACRQRLAKTKNRGRHSPIRGRGGGIASGIKIQLEHKLTELASHIRLHSSTTTSIKILRTKMQRPRGQGRGLRPFTKLMPRDHQIAPHVSVRSESVHGAKALARECTINKSLRVANNIYKQYRYGKVSDRDRVQQRGSTATYPPRFECAQIRTSRILETWFPRSLRLRSKSKDPHFRATLRK